jgi:hypothetical protein
MHNWYRVFPGGKERPVRDADPSPPSSAVDHERVELYLYFPYGLYGLYRSSVPVQGCILLFFKLHIIRLRICSQILYYLPKFCTENCLQLVPKERTAYLTDRLFLSFRCKILTVSNKIFNKIIWLLFKAGTLASMVCVIFMILRVSFIIMRILVLFSHLHRLAFCVCPPLI